jgi:hypothetical protein
MACTTVYTHIGLLTSKGLAQRGEWRRRMEEKEVRNEWSQYGPRTVTVSRVARRICARFVRTHIAPRRACLFRVGVVRMGGQWEMVLDGAGMIQVSLRRPVRCTDYFFDS